MREYYQKFAKNNNNLKGKRMNSPPEYYCSSGTASSSLSQPISLEFRSQPISLQNLSSSKENNNNLSKKGENNKYIKGKPIEFDDLIYDSEFLDNDFYWRNKNSFSSSEDLTTSDSEICRYSQNNRKLKIIEENNNKMIRFGKYPSLSTIYPNNSSLSLNDSELLKEEINQKRNNYYIKNNNKLNNNKLKQKTPQRIPTLEMVKAISPVLPRPPNPNEDFDIPPLPRPLQLIDREWHPLKTSTLANLHCLLPNNIKQKQNKLINNNIMSHKQVISLDPQPRSLFDPFFPQQLLSSSKMTARPEQFNLPSALAKSFGIKGILFIQISVIGTSLLFVHVRNGTLFLENSPSSCYVKVEIRRSPSNRKRSKYDNRFCYKLTSEVRDTNWPEFFDDFQFKIGQIHLQYGDKLGLSLYTTTFASPSATIAPAAELLGRMSFSLRKFFRISKQQQNIKLKGRQQSIQVCEGGFFLLPDKLGQQSHLSQNNILHRKYYDEIGITGCSSISSNSSFGSPFKMMSEPEWAPPIISSTLGRPNFIKNSNFCKNKKIAIKNNNKEIINCSNSSSSQSEVNCKRRALQQQIIADSSDFTSSILTSSIDVNIDSFNNNNESTSLNCSSRPFLSKQLENNNNNKLILYSSSLSSSTELTPLNKEKKENNNIRRISSFTNSLQQQQQQIIIPSSIRQNKINNNNKRNSITTTVPLTDKIQRKNQLGPIGRTLYFLKSKLDFSLSASILCPSKEECRLWQEDFFTLLCHKYGCMLFREFLKSEFSEENLDFWLDVENFKQMKDSKKQTLQKAQYIFDTYIKELAPKEVNLDSETRMKTKNGLQSVPLRTDIFNLAQSKIEQLMSKDSYSRFLKSEQYLDLLDDFSNFGDKPRSSSNGLLRISSTKSNGSINNKITKASRSPSLSPKLGGSERYVRRNTCSPVSPINLQIPNIRE